MQKAKTMAPDDIAPEVMAAHRQVCAGLSALRDAVACPACYARELGYVAAAVEDLIEDAEAAAEGAEHGAVH